MIEQIRAIGRAIQRFADREGRYLTFLPDQEEYGISIRKVKEIIGMMRITPVPQTPEFVKGVINLRGKVIPVIDLRLRFGMGENGYTDRTCIVVVEKVQRGGRAQNGRRVGAGLRCMWQWWRLSSTPLPVMLGHSDSLWA